MKKIVHSGRTFVICFLFSSSCLNLFAQTPELVADINLTGNANPNNFAQLNNLLLFSADDGINGTELLEK